VLVGGTGVVVAVLVGAVGVFVLVGVAVADASALVGVAVGGAGVFVLVGGPDVLVQFTLALLDWSVPTDVTEAVMVSVPSDEPAKVNWAFPE
jgi:hypothetical protein